MEEDLSHDLENEYTARVLMVLAQELGFDPLFFDSNGAGGFHIYVIFEHDGAIALESLC